MSKLISLIIGYVLTFLIIMAYYKINNIRTPFSNWGGWKKDVKLKEKFIISFILQIPVFIIFVILEDEKAIIYSNISPIIRVFKRRRNKNLYFNSKCYAT